MKKLIIIPLLLIALAGFGQRPVVGTPVSYAMPSGTKTFAEVVADGNTWAQFEAVAGNMSYNVGDTINYWYDLTDNNIDLVNGVPTTAPRHAGDSVFFDGVDNYISYSSVGSDTLYQPFTAYIVFRVHEHNGTDPDAIFDAAQNNTCKLSLNTTGVGSCYLYAGSTAASSQTITINKLYVATVVMNGASSTLRLNNNAEETGLNPGTNNMEGIMLGSRRILGYWTKYAIFYVLYRDGVDSAEDQVIVRTEMNDKFSIY